MKDDEGDRVDYGKKGGYGVDSAANEVDEGGPKTFGFLETREKRREGKRRGEDEEIWRVKGWHYGFKWYGINAFNS